MFGDLFADREKEKGLQILSENGLPVTGHYWWTRYPKRCVDEIYRMYENTNAAFSHSGDNLIWEELIINDFETRFLISIETNSNFPFASPKVYVKDSELYLGDVKHQYDDGTLCLFAPSAYSTKMTILQIRNLSCAWCFCAEVYLKEGKWPAAELEH